MLCALCAIVPMLAQGFSGSGSGTSDDPYRIFNADQLNQVRNFLGNTDVFFSLEADIDLAPWLAENNPYEGWQPIGTESSPFKGTFNGNGHTISNLAINRPETDNVGLFGYVVGCNIYNITFHRCAITGNDYVGGIVGYVGYEASISKCVVYGVITGNDNIGGIAGGTDQAMTISTCLSNASIKGDTNIGGIVGTTSFYAKVEQCVSSSRIIGKKSVGGIAGGDHGHYNNCYTCGKMIEGTEEVGGIMGDASGSSNIVKCYSQTSLIAGNINIGGLAGSASSSYSYIQSSVAINELLVANSKMNRICPSKYYGGEQGTSNENKAWVLTKMLVNDEEQKPVEGLADGTNIGLSALKLKATYQGLGWDFDDVWEIQETETFPYFKTQTAPPYFTGTLKAGQTEISGQCVEDGTVTVRIGDKEYSAQSSGNTWTVTVDPLQGGETAEITVRADGKMPSYPVFADIELTGNGTAEDPFLVASAADLRGVTEDAAYYKLTQDIDLTEWIDENNPTGGWQPVGDDIYGVNIAELDGDGHKITGLWMDNSDLENVGIFSRFKGEIKDLYVEISSGKAVSGTSNVGAIAGTLRGSVTNCSVKGNLKEGKYVGSIAGTSTGSIAQCYAEGAITNATNSAYVGGLVGMTSGTVSDSYDDVTINASGKSNYSGGIAGYNTGTVSHCYATGNIVGDRIGGVVGYNAESTSKISGCVALNSNLTATSSAQRVLGGYGSNATTQGTDNYALKTMSVSVNNVPQTIYDDPLNGYAKTDEELKAKASYNTLSWDFDNVWKIDEATSYPYQEPFNVPVTSIVIDSTSATLIIGNSLQLKATVSPDNARNVSITWSSDNESVATVDKNGKVTAISAGNAVITAATNDGTNLSATCAVTVELPSGISNTQTDGVKIAVNDRTITLSGISDGSVICLHTIDGKCLYRGNSHTLTVPANGLYILTAESQSYKIIIE